MGAAGCIPGADLPLPIFALQGADDRKSSLQLLYHQPAAAVENKWDRVHGLELQNRVRSRHLHEVASGQLPAVKRHSPACSPAAPKLNVGNG